MNPIDSHRFGTRPSPILVRLETGEMKDIQHLTSEDLLVSAKQSSIYTSLVARVQSIRPLNRWTGEVELRLKIDHLDKTISYLIHDDLPFFVHPSSAWASISPDLTRLRYGLICRSLQCGDLILAISQ